MGSVIEHEKCPQCGGVVYHEYYYRTGEETQFCLRCGRWAKVLLPSSEEEQAKLLPGEKLLTRKGRGLGRCCIQTTAGVGKSFSLGEPYSEALDEWYMRTMKEDGVDPESSYLTKWDARTSRVIVVYGNDPGLYDDEFGTKEHASSEKSER